MRSASASRCGRTDPVFAPDSVPALTPTRARAPATVAAARPSDPPVCDARKTVLLLGPQGRRETLARQLGLLGIDGRVAVVTAGWQEREEETLALQAHLEGRAENLRLHGRADEVFEHDPELAAAHRKRQQTFRQLRRLYDLRLSHALEALSALRHRSEDAALVEEAREAALETVRRIDADHLDRIDRVHREWSERAHLEQNEVVARHRDEIGEILSRCAVVAIAGGHVAVLLNRLRLFDVMALAVDHPLVAWSAGAMALTDRVVVYHDTPPQGFGNPEVFERGFGLVRGLVALPHARRRLLLDDRERVARFARRFAPAACVTMDEEAALQFGPGGLVAGNAVRVLRPDGRLGSFEP